MANAIDASEASGQADTSNTTNDEDTNLDDITWEDGDTVEETEESGDDSAATEESPDTKEESSEEVETEAESDKDEAEESNDEEEADSSDDTEAQAVERQRQNDEAAQRRIADRQAKTQARQKAEQDSLEQAYSDSYDQAINAGFDDQQARIQAAQALTLQQLQVDSYNNRVMQVTNRVTADLNQAVSAIPEFKSDNPVIREAMLRAVDNFEGQYVQKDQNGDAVQVTGDLLVYLQNEAETIRRLTGLGAEQQVKAKNTQKKRTLTPGSRTPTKPKVDPDLAAFDEEYNRWQ